MHHNRTEIYRSHPKRVMLQSFMTMSQPPVGDSLKIGDLKTNAFTTAILLFWFPIESSLLGSMS